MEVLFRTKYLKMTNLQHIFDLECMYISIGTPSTPNSPLVTQSDCQSVTVSWEESRNNGGYSITSYRLRYRPIENIITSSDYTPWNTTTLSKTQAVLDGLLPGTIYLINVAATSEGGTSPFSESVAAVTNTPGQNHTRE